MADAFKRFLENWAAPQRATDGNTVAAQVAKSNGASDAQAAAFEKAVAKMPSKMGPHDVFRLWKMGYDAGKGEG